MRLHVFLICAVAVGLASSARADNEGRIDSRSGDIRSNDIRSLDNGSASKPLEANFHRPKKGALFAPQAQLFVEQKEAPAASKTALRSEGAPRICGKSKD